MRLRRTGSAPPLDRRYRIGGLPAVARDVRAPQSLAGPPRCGPRGPRHRVARVEPRPCPVSYGSDSAGTRRRSGLLRGWRQSTVGRGGLQISTRRLAMVTVLLEMWWVWRVVSRQSAFIMRPSTCSRPHRFLPVEFRGARWATCAGSGERTCPPRQRRDRRKIQGPLRRLAG